MVDRRSKLGRGLKVQANVLGALIMRELHTRYGRENIGYLWMILEPMLLAVAVAMIHAGRPTEFGSDIRPVPFAVIGYCIFMLFRGIFTRAEGALEGNTPLLYHRMVSIFDILFSRALLEGASIVLTMLILLGLAFAFGLAGLPARPLYLMTACVLMVWFAFALSMIICAATYERRLVARFIHPVSYVLLPLSGAFYQMAWIPRKYQAMLEWLPLTHVFEMARFGQFESAKEEFFSFPYLIGSCLVLTYLGLLCLKLVRYRVHLR